MRKWYKIKMELYEIYLHNSWQCRGPCVASTKLKDTISQVFVCFIVFGLSLCFLCGLFGAYVLIRMKMDIPAHKC